MSPSCDHFCWRADQLLQHFYYNYFFGENSYFMQIIYFSWILHAETKRYLNIQEWKLYGLQSIHCTFWNKLRAHSGCFLGEMMSTWEGKIFEIKGTPINQSVGYRAQGHLVAVVGYLVFFYWVIISYIFQFLTTPIYNIFKLSKILNTSSPNYYAKAFWSILHWNMRNRWL